MDIPPANLTPSGNMPRHNANHMLIYPCSLNKPQLWYLWGHDRQKSQNIYQWLCPDVACICVIFDYHDQCIPCYNDGISFSRPFVIVFGFHRLLLGIKANSVHFLCIFSVGDVLLQLSTTDYFHRWLKEKISCNPANVGKCFDFECWNFQSVQNLNLICFCSELSRHLDRL